MKHISLSLLFFLFLSFCHQIEAQTFKTPLIQDSIITPAVFQNGKTKINNLKLITEAESLENLFLEVHIAPQPQSKIFVQNPIRIEVIRLSNGKTEYIEIARFFLPWYASKNKQAAVFVFDLSAYSSLFLKAVTLQIESNNPALSLPLKMHFKWKTGLPPAQTKHIANLWRSPIKGFVYGDKTINQQIKTKSVHLTKDVKYALLKIYLSGSGQENKMPTEAECSKSFFLKINGKTVAKEAVWRDDCSLNALFPQSGPWMYSRPNWCPGQVLRVFDYFIPLGADTTLSISLQLQEATKINPMLQNYMLSANLILFQGASFKNDAELLEILAPNKNLAHNRYNPICSSPVIRIRNTGSDTLKSVLIQYGLDKKTDNRYRWRGELAFMEEEILYLPPVNWYFNNTQSKPKEFCVSIADVNHRKDEYPRNNDLSSTFLLAPVYPRQISIQFNSNKAASDNILELLDDMGVPLFEASDFVNDSLYTFDLELQPGCYEFIIYDQKGDGISYSGNKKGNGSLKIINTKTKAELNAFEPNFGAEIRQQFMILK